MKNMNHVYESQTYTCARFSFYESGNSDRRNVKITKYLNHSAPAG